MRRRLSVLLLSMAAASFFSAPLWALLPAYVESALRAPTTITGLLRAVSMATAGVVFAVGGAVADGLGSRRAYLIGLAALGSSGFVYLAAGLPLLLGLSILIGVGNAFLTTGGQSYLMRTAPDARIGTGASLYFISMILGQAAGSAVFGFVADHGGYRLMGWILVGGMAATILGAAMLLTDAERTERPGQGASSILAGYGDLLGRREIRWLLAVRFLPTCMWGASWVAIPYLMFVATGSNQTAGYYTMSTLLVAAAVQYPVGRWCDRVGPRRCVIFAASAIPVTSLVAALFVGSTTGLWLCGIAYTSAAWSLSTMMPPLMNTISTGEERGRIVGIAHVAWALGMGVGMYGAGWLLTFSAAAPFYVGTAFCLATVYCAWRVTRRGPVHVPS